MANVGRLIPSQATIRISTHVGAGSAGNVTPVSFPSGRSEYAYSLTVSAPNAMTGTLYIAQNIGTATNAQTISTATRREREMIRLKAGESYTFTGVPGSDGQYREVAFGTGISYLHASDVPKVAVITYYKLG